MSTKSFEENGAALLIGRIAPGAALQPLDDPAGKRIARCLQRLAHVSASSVRSSLPSGLERLDALIAANARHLRALSPSLRQRQDRIIALANAVGRSQGPQERAVLLHGDLHAGNLLIGSNNELVVIDPTPALNSNGSGFPAKVRRAPGLVCCASPHTDLTGKRAAVPLHQRRDDLAPAWLGHS